MADGRLMLMELEDYNPYLSLSLISQPERRRFVQTLCESIKKQINQA
jgi:hypothetical protein